MSPLPNDARAPYQLPDKVAIFVPSRYASGQPIPSEVCQNQVRLVAGALAQLFGGATAEQIENNSKNLTGTFVHTVDKSDRFVDEDIRRVWTGVEAGALSDEAKRTAVLAEAIRLQNALLQESILVEWGSTILLTPTLKQPDVPFTFSSFSKGGQERFALMAWSRVKRPFDLAGVFSLAGWSFPAEAGDVPDFAVPSSTRSPIAWEKAGTQRVAWHWTGTAPPAETQLKELATDHLLVMAAPDARLRVWLRTKQGIAGSREIPLATEDRPTSRLAIEFAVALLDGQSSVPLPELLNAEGATGRFYKEIRDRIGAISRALKSSLQESSAATAQRLIGRLMFLRFVEEKGWLPKNTLRSLYERKKGGFYRDALQPLFRLLNTLETERDEPKAFDFTVPYLNGGLFAFRGADDMFDLADELFSLEDRDGILNVLYRYQFTLDEAASRDELVSVDPAMFGRVLESLTSSEDRKNKGVHYTPAPIARALAMGAIVPQLVSDFERAGVPAGDITRLESFCRGQFDAISSRQAEQLLARMQTLRIIDPAVGSGALLVACLEVLLEISRLCEQRLGGDLRRGTVRWATRARYFVRHCLFGVDISREAIEVAQLRLWLYLSVGEAEPTPLPDLGHNLRVGDSLRFDPAESRLFEYLQKKSLQSRTLEFDGVDTALNSALNALQDFHRAADGSPLEQRLASRTLEVAQQQLRNVLSNVEDDGTEAENILHRHAEIGSEQQAPPFAWALHFADVFNRPNRGFDVVIANPPYVRTSSLPSGGSAQLKKWYRSMKSKNVDLYYAFLERALRAPLVSAGRHSTSRPDVLGLAGKGGSIAFIMPSFAQTTSAENLRALFAEGGHVDRWVDFIDLQVFSTATNYVALLFASAQKRDRKTFPVQLVTPTAFEQMLANRPWLDLLPSHSVPYRTNGWDIRSSQPVRHQSGHRLGELVSIQVGIQTSLDALYLYDYVANPKDPTLVIVRNAREETTLERGILFPCAKGARELHGGELTAGCFVLWPYDQQGILRSPESLAREFPLAWSYLLKNRAELESRENGKFRDELWYRFRRPQGVKCASQPKILVPSIMQIATAYHDAAGKVICTASGKGGGGGWVLQCREDRPIHLEKLAHYLRSDANMAWLRDHAEPKKGGWLGVDRKTLERCPIPESLD